MEVWDPESSEIKLLWDEIPPEVGGSRGLSDAKMTTISGGSELIVYGGWSGREVSGGIWKYSAIGDTWKR